jgi:xylulokinase
MLTIGLDVGTQGTKCVIYDVDSKQIKGRGAVSYGLNSERHGQAEQNPAVWIQVRYDSNADLSVIFLIGQY